MVGCDEEGFSIGAFDGDVVGNFVGETGESVGTAVVGCSLGGLLGNGVGDVVGTGVGDFVT